ncbi:MAG: hypothetical protein R6U29_03425, partial [Desulfosudaceae bacterium]
MNKNAKKILCRIAVFLFPIFFIGIIILLKKLFPIKTSHMFFEDGVIEYLQVIICIIIVFLTIAISVKSYRLKEIQICLTYIILSIMFFVIGMEEISWGQRILNIDKPGFFIQNNPRNELNIHNLSGLFIPFFIAHLFFATWSVFRLFIPEKYKNALTSFSFPSYLLIPYFLPFLIYSAHFFSYTSFYDAQAINTNFFTSPFVFGETLELILYIGFLIFVLHNYRKIILIDKKSESFNNNTILLSYISLNILFIIILFLFSVPQNFEKKLTMFYAKKTLEIGKEEFALKSFRSFIKKSPDSYEANATIGLLMLKHKNLTDALYYSKKAYKT